MLWGVRIELFMGSAHIDVLWEIEFCHVCRIGLHYDMRTHIDLISGDALRCPAIRLIHSEGTLQVTYLSGGSVSMYSRTGVSVALPHHIKNSMDAAHSAICLMTD